jgi:hypothetical protein
MRTVTKKPARFMLFLFAAIAGVAILVGTKSAQATHPVEVETGRPSILINRPFCGPDGFLDESSRCHSIEWLQSKDRLWLRPDP